MQALYSIASAALLVLLVVPSFGATPPMPRAVNTYDALPMVFEENHGQSDGVVKFLARGNGYGIFVAGGEIVFVLRDRANGDPGAKPAEASVVRIQFPGSNPDAAGEGLAPLPGVSHYIRGNDPSTWTNAAQFSKVRMYDVYPGIDLLLYGSQGQLEYDVIAEPGADLSVLRLHIVGGKTEIDHETGDLLIDTSHGTVRQKLPVVFEEESGKRRSVDSRYSLDNVGDVRFVIGKYASTATLVIDPVVIYSTYHGGNDQDAGFGIAADTSGNAYVVGYTSSTDFQVASAYQGTNASNFITEFTDAFVSKFSSDGSTLLYSTYLGGDGDDLGIAIAIDSSNNAYITGRTDSSDFPLTPAGPNPPPYQSMNAGGVFDAFVAKLDSSGGLAYSTFVGGSLEERAEGIALDAAGNAYVSGYTTSVGMALMPFPSTITIGPAGGVQDGFAFKLNSTGSALVYSALVGGSAADYTDQVSTDASGNAYVAGTTESTDFPTQSPIQAASGGGRDVTLYRINATGTALDYSTYLGGSGQELALAVQVDALGNAYYAGRTDTPFMGFPTSPGAFLTTNMGSDDVFVAKLTPAGAMAYSTLLGTAAVDLAHGVGVDSNGNATIAGETSVIGDPDVFIAKVNSTGTSQVYGVLFRGSSDDHARDLHFDAQGYAYVTGYTNSSDFGAFPGGGLTNPRQPALATAADAFVIKFTDSVDLQVTKTDGQTTDAPGTSITYTITVTNPGPSDATGATVVDTFPASLTSVTYTAVAAGGATGFTAAGMGDINDTVDIPVGGSITYTVMATISPDATGTLSNTATATPDSMVVDIDNTNNSATDMTDLIPTVDASITKTDGTLTATPGTTTQYTIVVTNSGPSTLVGATVTDTFPLTGVTWTASQMGGATGFSAIGSGNINDIVTMPVGSTITYIATGTISAAATGTLSNTATFMVPMGTTDTNSTNDSATDIDTLTPQAELSITKTDGTLTATPGTTTQYTIVVANSGPSNVTGATVTDTFPGTLTGVTWTASQMGGATGFTTPGMGNISDIVNMPVGSIITYIATGTISAAATGTLSNTATFMVPMGTTDTDSTNDSATDVDTLTPQADLSITKTDGMTSVMPGETVTYTIVVSNSGPSNVIGASVVDTFSPNLSGVTYTAVASGAATGFTAAGSGNISDTVNLAVGSSITYTATGLFVSSDTGTLVNTATVTAPGGTTDPDPSNNSATDTDTLPAPAPAMDVFGLLCALAMLAFVGGVALRRI